MATLRHPGILIYRNIYIKGYERVPYQKFTGRKVLMYRGKVIFYKDIVPDKYDPEQDFLIDCDCEFPKWKNIKRIL